MLLRDLGFFRVLPVGLIASFIIASSPGTSLAEDGRIIAHTPFDQKMASAGVLDPSFYSSGDNRSPERLFAECRSFRYSKDRGRDHWQSPAETQARRSGDCEDKAIWIFSHLQNQGFSDVRFVIGRYRNFKGGLHVWVTYRGSDGGVYILDPAMQRRIWRTADFSSDFYHPLFSFDGTHRYSHSS